MSAPETVLQPDAVETETTGETDLCKSMRNVYDTAVIQLTFRLEHS